MKRFIFPLLAGSLLLAGCFETTQEITLNEDGTGTVSTTNDMSAVLGLAKQMGGANDLEKMEGTGKIDTTISLVTLSDSIENLTADEKEMLKKGIMNMKMDLKGDQFQTKLVFSFTHPDEILAYDKLTSKIFGAAMKEQMSASPLAAGMGNGIPEMSSFDDYYVLDASKGELKKSLNKEKYAGLQNDEYMKEIKEAAGMGIPVTATYIINLPRPATKVDGKNLTLSEDKMKVTVKVDIDDLFENPEKLEFKIKY